MSKQLKLKFKKTLKNAEFTHADLEYHEELLVDAKKEFSEAVNDVFSTLPSAVQDQLHEMRNRRAMQHALDKRKEEEEEKEEESSTDLAPPNKELLITPENPEGIDLNAVYEDQAPPDKESECKKIFYKIAGKTHPDKMVSGKFSEQEAARLEKLFKRALGAYEDNNWYTLYSLALDLDIEVDDPTEDSIEWLHQDIRQTMSRIKHISIMVAWIWYNGEEATKKMAIISYFQQMFDYDLKL